MRITHEADYAIRVAFCLADCGGKLSAKEISEKTDVSLRFALKILRKLIQAEMVCSYKGANGGYALAKPPSEISMGAIIECIDGPISINYCLNNEFACSHTHVKSICNFRNVFGSINTMIRDELYRVTLDQFLN